MKWAGSLTNYMVENRIITNEDAPLYQYGFEQGAFYLLNWAIAIPILFICNMLWEGIVFLVCYGLLRVNAGGAHARTRVRCTFYSAILLIISGLAIKYIPFSIFDEAVILICSGCVIHSLAPVEDENKPLDLSEIYHFGKRAHIIFYSEFVIWAVMTLLGSSYSSCIVIATLTLAVMLVIGALKNLRTVAQGIS